MEARARDAARPKRRQPPGRSRAAHPRPRGLLNHLIPNPADEPFLAQIYAAPEDDAPRQVFADALTERGDPRGEFITLQLARARGLATPAQVSRERELSAEPPNRIAWGRPHSRSGTCHLSRGLADELVLNPRYSAELIDHPCVSTLHALSGFHLKIPPKVGKALLQQRSASRLRRVADVSKELFESLEMSIPWPSVGLDFYPCPEHHAQLRNVTELTLGPARTPVTVSAFKGLPQLKKLKIRDAAPEALSPLEELVELEVQYWRRGPTWGEELAGLEKLERLTLGAPVTGALVEGLPIKVLGALTSLELEVDPVIQGLPALEELRLWCGTSAATHMTLAKLLASQLWTHLRFVSAGILEFTCPGAPEATLELRAWKDQKLEEYENLIASLPAGLISKLIIRPKDPDPWVPAGPPPQGIEAIRAAAKVPVELAWY